MWVWLERSPPDALGQLCLDRPDWQMTRLLSAVHGLCAFVADVGAVAHVCNMACIKSSWSIETEMVHDCAYHSFEWLLEYLSVETADRSAGLLGKARQGQARQGMSSRVRPAVRSGCCGVLLIQRELLRNGSNLPLAR